METLKSIEAAGMEIYYALSTARQNGVLDEWIRLKFPRDYLRTTLMELLRSDLKFCLTDQLGHQIWQTTYHGVIETLKELMAINPEMRDYHKDSLLGLIDEVWSNSFFLVLNNFFEFSGLLIFYKTYSNFRRHL